MLLRRVFVIIISGDEARLYEMCEEQVATLKGKVHLMTRKSSHLYSTCQCSMKSENNSLISVTIKDMRLYSTAESLRKCSKSVLKIDESIFACNATSKTFGSIFNEALPTKKHNESSITVSLDVKDSDYEMVWLTVETQGLYRSCHLARSSKH